MSVFFDYVLYSSSGGKLFTDNEEEKAEFIKYYKDAGSDVAVYQLNEDESVGIE